MSELVFNYIKYEDQRFYPRDHEISTQDAQYTSVIHLVLAAIESFLRYAISDVPERSEVIASLHEVDEKITEIEHLAWDSDFRIKG